MIQENIRHIKETIPTEVLLVAVSKTHGPEKIMEAYHAGIRHFGENKVQELINKKPLLPDDICWHMIGHLQTNKVKYIAPFIYLIHSVDSENLLAEINKQANKHSRKINVLIEVRIAQEETKFGLIPQEVESLLLKPLPEMYPNVEICGLMGMASFTDNTRQISDEFAVIQNLFNKLKAQHGEKYPNFNQLSIGMSSDYRIAIQHGSTIVRIGSSIFGERIYR